MFAQVVTILAIVAVAHAGGIALGYGFGGSSGYGGGLGQAGGLGGYSTIGGSGIAIGKQSIGIDYYAPPKYEYKYSVQDPHTGDQKEQVESRIGDLTKDEYALAEKDRAIRVSRIIAGAVPLVGKSYGYGGY